MTAVRYRLDGPVARILIDNPARRNAMSHARPTEPTLRALKKAALLHRNPASCGERDGEAPKVHQ